MACSCAFNIAGHKKSCDQLNKVDKTNRIKKMLSEILTEQVYNVLYNT